MTRRTCWSISLTQYSMLGRVPTEMSSGQMASIPRRSRMTVYPRGLASPFFRQPRFILGPERQHVSCAYSLVWYRNPEDAQTQRPEEPNPLVPDVVRITIGTTSSAALASAIGGLGPPRVLGVPAVDPQSAPHGRWAGLSGQHRIVGTPLWDQLGKARGQFVGRGGRPIHWRPDTLGSSAYVGKSSSARYGRRGGRRIGKVELDFEA